MLSNDILNKQFIYKSIMNHLNQITAPLATDQRGMTYLDDYLLLETEHQKHQSLYGEKPDYALILEKSTHLLEQGSGHFLVIVSACNALLQLYQWPGFTESLNFLNRLLEKEWNQIFPGTERLKGRIQMLDWLQERWQQFIETHPTQGLSTSFLQTILLELNNLQATLQTYCGEEINLISIIKPFETTALRLRNEKQAQEAQQQAEQARQAQETLQTTLQQNSQPISQDEYLSDLNTEELYEYASLRLARENLSQLQDESKHYGLLKLHRALVWWGPIQATQHLDWDAFSAALRLKAEQNHLEALIAFETLFLQCPLFLDLQYHLCDCLESLGAEPNLISMIQHEVQQLCAHAPELEHTYLEDKIPLANKHTCAYFELFTDKKKPELLLASSTS